MASTYVALSTVTVGSGGASDITFSNIPQTYDDLIVVVSGRGTASLNSFNEFAVWLNGDTFPSVSNRFTRLATNGTTITGSFNFTYLQLGDVPNANSSANVFGNATFLVSDYVNNNTWKSINALSISGNGTTTASVTGVSPLRSIVGPITSMVLWNSGNWAQYSTATLYGVFKADVSSAPSAPTIGTATGQPQQASVTFTGVSNAASYTVTSSPGNITSTGTFSPIIVKGLTAGTSYTFTVKANNPFGSSGESAASNSVTPTVAIDYLVVAGGAGGSTGYSGAYGGASGAGGVRSSFGTTGGYSAPEAPITLTTSTNYTVVVGTGGARATSDNSQGNNGNNSTFHTITSTGGGAGAGTNNGGASSLVARSGGNGGGAAFGSGIDIGGAGTVGQGFAGNNYIGGGQAGAGGSSGAYPFGIIDGQSSQGVQNNITDSTVEYGKGGFSTGSTTQTGYGNGGNGGRYTFGSGQEPSNGNAGVVILRYPSAYTISLSGVSGSTATVGSSKVTTITSGSGTVSWT
jgi:hypothetical protein